MKYDLIVAGAGPGGLMAARTAAADGLKVLLFDRKRDITRITRACSQIFYIKKLSPSGDDTRASRARSDGYIDPVSVEAMPDKTVFRFHTPGFSLDYTGQARPYLNWMHISPVGNIVHRYRPNERIWGFYYNKETFVEGLLADVQKAGVEVRAETMGLGAENVPGGVRVRLRTKAGEETVEGQAAIAADGLQSHIAESAGLNAKRQFLGASGRAFLQYVLEGVETDYPSCSWLTWLIPSLNPYGFIAMGQSEEDRCKLGSLTAGGKNPEDILVAFMKHPKWAQMFKNARVVKKEAMGGKAATYGPIKEPVAGNVVVVGDAGAPAETWIQGAVACGYQAVKAIEKELGGQSGYPGYIAWWQQAFAFNTPDYIKMITNLYPLPRICSDEEIDYVYGLCRNEIGIPQKMVGAKLDIIRAERPDLYERLRRSKPGEKL